MHSVCSQLRAHLDSAQYRTCLQRICPNDTALVCCTTAGAVISHGIGINFLKESCGNSRNGSAFCGYRVEAWYIFTGVLPATTILRSKTTLPQLESTRGIQKILQGLYKKNKKLCYSKQHSAPVVLRWCTTYMTFIGRQSTDQQLIYHFYVIGHESYQIL